MSEMRVDKKACSKCKEIYPIESFYKRKGSVDGHASTCKKCSDIACKKYREKIRKSFENGTRKIKDKKRCSRCKEIKTSEHFYRSNTKPGGLQPYCKDCTKIASMKNWGE